MPFAYIGIIYLSVFGLGKHWFFSQAALGCKVAGIVVSLEV